jgi:hypothetical protein
MDAGVELHEIEQLVDALPMWRHAAAERSDQRLQRGLVGIQLRVGRSTTAKRA